MFNIEIDGQRLQARSGETILQVAKAAGIVIPTLCYHPDLSVAGSCRLCLVHEEQSGHLVPACQQRVTEGMVVQTHTPQIVAERQFVLRLLLANYLHDPAVDTSQNELLHWAKEYGIESVTAHHSLDSDPSPVIRVNLQQCILCTRCIRACSEIQGRFVWNLADRGHETHLVAGTGTTMHDARCESCGACAAYCPTGALADRNSLGIGPSDRKVTTTCAYCGVGCQFDLQVKDEKVVRVTSNPNAPVNGHSLCVKGRYGYEYLHHPDRLRQPRVRQAHLLGNASVSPEEAKKSPWVDVDWPTALRVVADRLARIIRESGPNAVSFLSSAKCTNEENYLLQKLARQIIGTNNIDHCARLCHSPTVAGLSMSLGSGAMSNSMDDLRDFAQLAFVIGSNTTEQHPVFGAMLRQAVLKRGMKLIVADPRKIDLTEFATLHLRQKPGTDACLLNGIMHLILKAGAQDMEFIAARCESFEPFAASLERYTPEYVCDITGVSIADLKQAAELFVRHRPGTAIWAMGITQHTTGVSNVLALSNLQMLLGNFGKPGSGVNPLRGQNNVQGACDMGALPNLFTGYQPVTSPEAATKFGTAWKLATKDGSPRLPLSNIPGLTATEMIAGGDHHTVRGLYILGEDPAMTEPDSNHTRRSLSKIEFVVLQEIFPSETAMYADVILPGAAFAEKSGTFTNTERRVQLVQQAIAPPGESRADWQIISQLAKQLMHRLELTPQGPQAGWNYASPVEILEEIAALTPSYAGINVERLTRGERLQWPVPSVYHPGTPILHREQFTRGLGKFHIVEHLPAHELPDAEYPLLLTTGRVLYHWHGGELSRRSPMLLAECPAPQVELSPEDAKLYDVANGEWLTIESRRGEIQAEVVVTDRVAAGVIFGNFHFAGSGNVNNLTINVLDPIAKIPEFKVCAARIVTRK